MFTIDEIRIEGEEDGFHLVLYLDGSETTGVAAIDDAIQGGPLRFRIGLPDQFRAEVERTIGAWLAEGEAAQDAAIPRDNAYAVTDPKRPEYHEIVAGQYDNREGK